MHARIRKQAKMEMKASDPGAQLLLSFSAVVHQIPPTRNQFHIHLYGITLLCLLRSAHVKEPPVLWEWSSVSDEELDETYEAGGSEHVP